MAVIHIIFIMGCLLKGFLCKNTKRNFNIIMPTTVEALTGSCLTIPCSFDIRQEFDGKLNNDCKAKWIEKAKHLIPVKEKQANLTHKNCTSTFLNMRWENASKYSFRLECNNELKWTFENLTLNVKVTDRPPSPTLSPSSLKVNEGTSVSLTCSAPAPCPSHPPTLSWTPKLGDSQETLQETQNQTKVQISVLNFIASHLHHGKNIKCTAVYRKQDDVSDVPVYSSLTADVTYSPKDTRVSVSPSGPTVENRSVSLTCSSDAHPPVQNYSWYRADGGQETLIGHGRVLNITTSIDNRVYFCKAANKLGAGCSNITHINVHIPPWIRALSHCTKAGNQINCSCDTGGNPAPTLNWSLEIKTASQSETIKINTDSLNKTHLRSSITLSLSQINGLSTLKCSSFNSLGSAEHQFSLGNPPISGEEPLLLIILLTVALLVLMCVLLFVIRFLNKRNKLNTGPLAERNEETDNIYANTNELGEEDTAQPLSDSQQTSDDSPSSAANEGAEVSPGSYQEEVIYSSITFKAKRNSKAGKKYENVSICEKSCQTEKRFRAEDVGQNFVRNALEMGTVYAEVVPKKKVEFEYASVHF